MSLQASFSKKTFQFSFVARTSRGSMRQKDSWFLKVWDDNNPEVVGIGETGPLPGLSNELAEDVEKQLEQIIHAFRKGPSLIELSTIERIGIFFKSLNLSSSVLFGVETALLDLKNGGERIIYRNHFLTGHRIPINGLVWMGGLDFMLQQVSIKIDEGFSCLKLKIGGINFEKEVDILQFIRRKYFRDVISLRLDANGSFKPDNAMAKLVELARYDVDSIEQPLKAGSPFLEEICKQSPIPIGLDEELIGVTGRDKKVKLLERIRPQFVILKPTLHGGISGCQEWISVAEEHNIGWWITSALESNIGLNAIAQLTSEYPIAMPQGLGTGAIYENNVTSPLTVKKGHLYHNSKENWDLEAIN